jgi:hypothetical protein
MSTRLNLGASGGPCGELEEEDRDPSRSDSHQPASTKPGVVHSECDQAATGRLHDPTAHQVLHSPRTEVMSDPGSRCSGPATEVQLLLHGWIMQMQPQSQLGQLRSPALKNLLYLWQEGCLLVASVRLVALRQLQQLGSIE